MNMAQVLGIVILVVGVVLLGFGINATDALTERVVEGVSGRYTDNTMWYIIGGTAMVVGGAALLLFGRSRN